MVCTSFLCILNMVVLLKSWNLNPRQGSIAPARLIGKYSSADVNREHDPSWDMVAQNNQQHLPLALIVLWGSRLAGGDGSWAASFFVLYSSLRFAYVACN